MSLKLRLKQQSEQDLSAAAGADVNIDLFHVDDVEISQPEGICIDELIPTQLENHPNANLLALDDAAEDVEVQIYSHLLKK